MLALLVASLSVLTRNASPSVVSGWRNPSCVSCFAIVPRLADEVKMMIKKRRGEPRNLFKEKDIFPVSRNQEETDSPHLDCIEDFLEGRKKRIESWDEPSSQSTLYNESNGSNSVDSFSSYVTKDDESHSSFSSDGEGDLKLPILSREEYDFEAAVFSTPMSLHTDGSLLGSPQSFFSTSSVDIDNPFFIPAPLTPDSSPSPISQNFNSAYSGKADALVFGLTVQMWVAVKVSELSHGFVVEGGIPLDVFFAGKGMRGRSDAVPGLSIDIYAGLLSSRTPSWLSAILTGKVQHLSFSVEIIEEGHELFAEAEGLFSPLYSTKPESVQLGREGLQRRFVRIFPDLTHPEIKGLLHFFRISPISVDENYKIFWDPQLDLVRSVARGSLGFDASLGAGAQNAEVGESWSLVEEQVETMKQQKEKTPQRLPFGVRSFF